MHETVRGMHRLSLADKKTMRDFDLRCLTAVEAFKPSDIVALREAAGVSQAVFARALNVTADYVSKIERGAKQPSGPALKLLSLMRRKGFEAIL
jgi:putative transcriptional regulator